MAQGSEQEGSFSPTASVFRLLSSVFGLPSLMAQGSEQEGSFSPTASVFPARLTASAVRRGSSVFCLPSSVFRLLSSVFYGSDLIETDWFFAFLSLLFVYLE